MTYRRLSNILLALCAVACAPKHTLFEGRRSEYSIVIGKDASPIVPIVQMRKDMDRRDFIKVSGAAAAGLAQDVRYPSLDGRKGHHGTPRELRGGGLDIGIKKIL